ncbi:MAG: M23 family peptidase [Pseudolabrys sp.]|nr:M23 family peptidase [Pseudolabrys sp.]MSP31733.1 M23 family peptidase [Pseudolabrys sp.]
MSHLSHSHRSNAEYASHYAHGRGQSAASASQHLHRFHDGYTLVHGGRQVRIGPVAFWIVVGTLVAMAVWSIGTGTYFAFTDAVLTRLIGRQAELQFAYEDRIAELRAQVDRITSRQLLDQEQFEQKLSTLMQRQTTLERRTTALSSDVSATGSIRPARIAPPVEAPKPVRPSPINDTVIFVAPPDREARLQSRELPASITRIADRANGGGLDSILARVAFSLDKVERKQTAALTDLEEQIDTKARRMRSVLSDLGVNVGKAPENSAVGGPFVPLKAPQSGASAFERQLYRIHVARAQVNLYSHTLIAVPVRKPVVGDVDMSSPFGMRMDPFMKGPAIHTGIDLRGDKGDPVRVTANGTVSIASWQGGYGNMVEIDHGNGFSTRYGHMSQIDVKVGQAVRIGQTLGKIGSTGRSTGPHLHYETRIDGEAVDPQKFLRAGLRLGNV